MTGEKEDGKMKRRIISVLLALVLALSLVPTTALASQPDAEPEQPQIQADGAQQNGDTPQPAPAADGEESVQPEEQDTPDQPEGEENAPAAPEAETTDAPAQPADDDQAPQIAEPQPLLPADGGQNMPSVRIGSSADAHRHCVCGASHETVGDHTAEDFGAEAWTGVEYLSDIKTSGYYYLIKNITLSSGSSYGNFQWSLPTGINVVLCLNGHSISRDGASEKDSVIAVPRGSTLTITDCQDNGKITCAANKTGILVTGGGTLNLYGGKITGNKCGVKISADGTFNLYGGSISGNGSADQIECYGVDNAGTFNLYGGSISDNTANSGAAVRIGSPASFTMSGGTIANNTGSYGGVYLTGTDSAFTMSGGSITGNTTTYEGGGVYVKAGAFTMTGGSITGNTTAKNGGGVCVSAGTFTMTGGIITGNNATEKGGGVYVYDKSVTIKISGTPQIYGNVENGTQNAAGLYEDGKISNLYLYGQDSDSNRALIKITDSLQDGAAIGVTLNVFSKSAIVTFAVGEDPYTVKESDLQYFFSDENHKIVGSTYYGFASLGLSPDPAPHTHYLCGRVCTCPANSKETAKTEFTEWTDAAAQAQYGADASAATCLPKEGSYYLSADVTLPTNTTWQPTGAVSLCLNGHTITGVNGQSTITVDKITLNLSDCTGKGKVTHSGTTVTESSFGHKDEPAATVGHGVQVSSGTFNLYGGSITGNSIRESENNGNGGGVHVASGSFTMYCGAISGNAANGSGSGVYVASGGAFTLYGGSIKDNKELITGSFGIETLAQNGGGVSCAGKFTMSGGVISGNAASGNGNGVYVAENAEFTMSGGTIAENANTKDYANETGGGVYNDGTFLLRSGTIRKNEAHAGGGVYNMGQFEMSGGSICENQASYYTGAFGAGVAGGGVYLTGTDSAFTMSGGSITGNKAEGNEDCRGGGVYNWRYDQTDGVFEVSGKVTITGNTYIAHYYLKKDEGPSNVFLAFTDKPIVIGKDGLNSASRIGIAQPNSGVTTIVAVKGVKDTATANCFTSDSSTYGKYYITPQNEIWLSTSAPHTHNWSYTTSGAVITARCDADNCPSPKGGSVTITPPTDPTYNGQAKAATVTGSFTNGTPKPTVITYWKNGETLSGAPINAGEYTASITVNDAVATLTYTIAKAAPQAADFTFTAPTGLTYNGQRHEASVTVNTNVDGMGQITQIHYYNASGEEVEPINAGVYLVKIDVAEGKNYTAQLTPADSSWCMQIQPDPSTPVVTLNGDMTYTGSQIKPAVTVTLNGRTLTETTDYTVTYGANINAGENAGTVTVTKTAAQSDNYTFTSVQQQFTIAPKEVTVSGITAADKIYDGNTAATLNYDGVTFTGKVEEDTLTVSASGAFADKNVGQHKAVTLTGLTLSGASANNYCLAASQQTYLIDLKALLKDSIGDLTFEDLSVTLTGGYYTGGASVTADGLLTLPINSVDSTATGSIGSVQLTVTSANYETFTLTVNITAENPRPEDVRPTPPADDDHNWVGVIRRYPAAVPAAAEQADVTSARTFDPGVTLYMALTLLSAAGTALLTGKRKEH